MRLLRDVLLVGGLKVAVPAGHRAAGGTVRLADGTTVPAPEFATLIRSAVPAVTALPVAVGENHATTSPSTT